MAAHWRGVLTPQVTKVAHGFIADGPQFGCTLSTRLGVTAGVKSRATRFCLNEL